VPGTNEWRSEIAGVVTAPKQKSTSAELSEEAQSILRTAAGADGMILHVRHLGGERIQVGGKNVIAGDDRRAIALWTGGLEDLQRRRLIKDRGHKGEVFEVTREGYEAADGLPKPG
jgi:hypothetical protein